MPQNRVIGTDYPQKDIIPKITGRARFAEDFRADGMLFAKLLLSPVPRGRVRRLDTSAALAMEGVYAVVTADDFPSVDPPGEPTLTNEPVYQGQPIAAVAAVDEATAAEAVERLRLEMERLPFALDPLDTLRPGSPNTRDEGNIYGEDGIDTLKLTGAQIADIEAGRRPEGLEGTAGWSFGDLDAAFAQSDYIIEEPILHQSQTHHPMEPRSSMAYWRNGRVFLHVSTQSTQRTRQAMASWLGIDQEDVVVISEYTGGGFGSKIRGTITDVIPAALAQKAGRPVLMRVTRDEETYFGRARTGLAGWVKFGFRADGKVLGIDLFLIQDNAPFGRQGDFNSAGSTTSLAYQPEAMRLQALPVLTNTPPRSAQRAPGGMQSVAMLEPVVDKAAKELGIDQAEIRYINAPTHRSPVGPNRNEVTSAFVREAIDLGRELFDWDRKKALSGQVNGTKVTGVSVVLSPYVGGSSGMDGLMLIRPDGRLYVHQGIGNLGTHSVFDTATPAAEILGVPWEEVEVVKGDTSRHLPWSTVQAGSQTTHAHSRANHAAAMDARTKLQEIAAQDLGGSPDDYEVGEGRVFRRASPGTGLTFAQAAERAIALGGRYDGHEVPEDINNYTAQSAQALAGQGLMGVARDNYSHDGSTYAFVVAFCRVEVDRETGVVDVKEYLPVTDCGTVLNPRSLAAQIHGGGLQGISVALFEKWAFDNQWGVNSNKRFYTAKPVSILDVPAQMDYGAVDLPDPETPVGAKGIGEPPIGAGAAAVAAAIADATGVYLTRTPLTPDKILNALEGRQPAYGRLQTHV